MENEGIILRIKEIMSVSGLNISETAKRIEVSQSNLSAILSGKRPVGPNMINKFILAFGVDKLWLETGSGWMFVYSDEDIRSRFTAVREELKLSVNAAASALGVSPQVVKDYESGKRTPNEMFIEDFVYTFNINRIWLFSGIGKKFTNSYYRHLELQNDHFYVLSRVESVLKSFNKTLDKLEAEGIITPLEHISFLHNTDESKKNNVIDKVTLYTGASREWLIEGKGPTFANPPAKENKIADIKITESHKERSSIEDTRPRIPYTAAAGSLTSAVEGVTASECEQIPVINAFPSYDFTIFIKGDSMEPKYESGDEVACKRIDESRFIQWGKVHVLDTTQGILIKRVYDDGEGIRCNSFNPDYPDFIIPKEEVFSMSLIVGLLRL